MSFFLRTARLGFRHWSEGDLPLALALWTDPAVMAHMGGPMLPEAAEARFRLEMANQQTYGIQYWPIFHLRTGEHAGCAGLRPFHAKTDVLEVGVHIARPFWSGRFGEEAARAVITLGFHHGAKALVAGHGPNNINSRALIERLGFRFTHEESWGLQQILHPYYRLEVNIEK